MVLNAGYSYRERIAAEGERVLDYLVRTRRHSSQAIWSHRIEQGEIEVDGHCADLETHLRTGQWLQWNRPPWDEPAVDAGFEIIFEDEALIAVAKPRGLPTMSGGGFLQQTLLAHVRKLYPEANPMHRLGRETSGLVLFSRNHSAAARLQCAWRGHEIRKVYRALGSGIPVEDSMEILTRIGPRAHPMLGMVHSANVDGKPSRSVARVLERRKTSTLFEVEITTGRPHQVRIHLASVGHPLVGDPLYGQGGIPHAESRALPGDGGYFLHAERLEFPHPNTGEWVILQATPPLELRMGWDQKATS